MQQRPTHHPEDLLTCEVCLKEIPASVAKSCEGEDYAHYFCGAECFDKWRRQKIPGKVTRQAQE